MMNLKTILFKLKLRKLRDGDFVTVEDEKGILRFYRVIGKQFNIKIDEYNKQEAKTRGRVAVLSLEGFIITYDKCIDFNISVKFVGKKFKLLRTNYIKEVH